MADLTDVYLRLALIPGLGPLTAQLLLEAVDDPREIFRLSMSQLARVDGIGSKRARDLCDPRFAEAVATERARAHSGGARIITRGDEDYPKDLLSLRDPPLALWIRGQLERRDRIAVAVVGPRRPSASGHRQAQRFAAGIARIGACVVSGLARGVDGIAHEAALDAGGRTIAVIGSGLGKLYPSEHDALAAKVASHGAVISEFPWETKPMPGNFPRRNRLVAALSLATLVIEAGERSGALITARLAGELGKEAMCLPGPVDRPECVGSNKLLRDGATIITSMDDLIGELAPLGTMAAAMADTEEAERPRMVNLNTRESQVYGLLSDQVRTVDDLVERSGLPASSISATLISLELRRMAKRAAGGYVRG